MYCFLDMLANGIKDCTIRYTDVFEDCPPNEPVSYTHLTLPTIA